MLLGSKFVIQFIQFIFRSVHRLGQFSGLIEGVHLNKYHNTNIHSFCCLVLVPVEPDHLAASQVSHPINLFCWYICILHVWFYYKKRYSNIHFIKQYCMFCIVAVYRCRYLRKKIFSHSIKFCVTSAQMWKYGACKLLGFLRDCLLVFNIVCS